MRLHVTFLVFLVAIGYWGYMDGGWDGAFWALTLFIALFACIALHELGHSVVAQQLGVQVRSITLLPIGGVAALKRIPENPWHEIAITLAGPLVNLIIAVLLFPLTGLPAHLFVVGTPHNLTGLLTALVSANLTLFIFNFIPAFPMDGGRLLRAVLALMISYRRATVIAATVGQGLAIVFMLAGLKWSVWLIVIGAFIFIGAEGEERMVRMRSLLRDMEVDEVMSHEFSSLTPWDNVARGLALVYQTGQDDFPVVDDGKLVGLVTRQDMVAATNAHGSEVAVGRVMQEKFPVITPQANLAQVYEEMMSEGYACLPVMEEGRLVGLLSHENISRYMLVQSSLKTFRRKPATPPTDLARTPAPPPVMAGGPPVAAPPPRATPGPAADRAQTPAPTNPAPSPTASA